MCSDDGRAVGVVVLMINSFLWRGVSLISLDAPDMHALVLGAVVGAAGDNHEHDVNACTSDLVRFGSFFGRVIFTLGSL